MSAPRARITNVIRTGLLVGAVAFGSLALPTPSASAGTFPGANGQIAFSSNRDGNYEIYVMNPDGSNLERLTNDPASDLSPAWSPDGSKIAFASDRDGSSKLYVMNADGTAVTVLGSMYGQDVAWSPDGSKVAYTGSNMGRSEVWIADADGSNATRLTDNVGGAYHNQSPSWSPDGSMIVYRSTMPSTTNYVLRRINVDGSNDVALTSSVPPAWDMSPSWSPDSSTIVFASNRSASTYNLFTMNADGSGVQALTNSAADEYSQPKFSPDGSKLIAYKGGAAPGIYMMNADGSGESMLLSVAVAVDPDWGTHPLTVPATPGGSTGSGGTGSTSGGGGTGNTGGVQSSDVPGVPNTSGLPLASPILVAALGLAASAGIWKLRSGARR